MPESSKPALDHLCELLELTGLREGGHAIVLNAYLDASERSSGVFCVAGLAYGFDRAKKATREWMRLWGDTPCHMTDLHNRRGAFRDWTSEAAGDHLKQSVRIMRAHASCMVAVSCDLAELQALLPDSSAADSVPLLDGFRTAYAMCCHFAMATFGDMTDGGLRYHFESGDRYQAQSQQFIAHATAHEPLRQSYGYAGHAVSRKQDGRLFETADILAWEWAKHIERMREGKGMRPSLAHLLNEPAGQFHEMRFESLKAKAMHLHGDRLALFARKIGAILAATTQEDVRAAMHPNASD